MTAQTKTVLGTDFPPAVVIWEAVKSLLRLSASDRQSWVDDANALRILQGPHAMFTEIPAYYQKRRHSATVCTVIDFALLQTWAQAGIDTRAVSFALADLFDAADSAPSPKIINSLRYFQNAVCRRQVDLMEARVGTRPEPPGLPEFTLLLALPRRGRAVYSAKMSLQHVQRAAQRIHPQLWVALTVIPDQWQISQIAPDFLESTQPLERGGKLENIRAV